VSHVVRGDVMPALAMAREGAQARPRDSWYPLVAGLLAHASGDPALAARTWADADPTGGGTDLIVDRLIGLGETHAAVYYARENARRHPADTKLRLALAEAFYRDGLADEALAEYAIALASPPVRPSFDWAEASYHRAHALEARERYADAIDAMTPIVGAFPGYAPYSGYLGRLYSLAGDPAAAKAWFDRTIRLSPSTGYPYWELGQDRLRAGEFCAAADWLERAARVEPGGPAYFPGDLGGALLGCGQLDRAIASLTEALRRQPDHEVYAQWLAEARRQRAARPGGAGRGAS
jgi:tetratricopeptide (TPR) repeat protein